MKISRVTGIILFCIVFIGFILRVFHVATNPPALSWDEVSIGYNAYSILKTGKDEHGKFLPLDTFVAYGDYKPPLAIYATVPSVAVFGLNEFSVRLPSVLFGTATILLTFFLVCLFFEKDKKRDAIALVSSTLLGLSPWHIIISRAGFEANIALFFVILGIYLVFYSVRKPKYWSVAFVPFVAAMYTFNSARYFVPFLGIFLFFFLQKSLRTSWKLVATGLLISFLLLVPIIPHLLSPQARLRFNEVNIFTDSGPVTMSNMRIAHAGNTWWANILANRRVYYFQSFAKHYLDHFDPYFLFIRGDGNPKFSIQDVGQLYAIELPFLLIGLIMLTREYPSISAVLIAWLLLAIIPAATARETPHALRILNTLPTWHIFTGYGLVWLVSHVPRNTKKLITLGIVVVLLGNVLYFLHDYFVHYPLEYSGEWQYGYREAYAITEKIKDDYRSIVVSGVIGRPYMYGLFYGKYDPAYYWSTKKDYFDAAGFYHVASFGKYTFPETGPSVFVPGVLYVLPSGSKPEGATEVGNIKLLNGNTVLSVFHL